MTKEKIYDEEIFPLMKKIIAICKESKIAMIADFGLNDGLHCTAAQLPDEFEPSEGQIAAFYLLKPKEAKRNYALAETIETRPDGSKKLTISRIS